MTEKTDSLPVFDTEKHGLFANLFNTVSMLLAHDVVPPSSELARVELVYYTRDKETGDLVAGRKFFSEHVSLDDDGSVES